MLTQGLFCEYTSGEVSTNDSECNISPWFVYIFVYGIILFAHEQANTIKRYLKTMGFGV